MTPTADRRTAPGSTQTLLPLPPGGRAEPDRADDTDFYLSPSAAVIEPVDRPPGRPPPPASSGATGRATLDPETRLLFLHRLRLCCLIAAVPFGFLSVSAATNFIDLVGRTAVGWSGLGLSVGTLGGLLVTAAVLTRRRRGLGENWLRALEVGVFGTMGACFAYWQFAVLTADTHPSLEISPYEQSVVVAAALLTHFNWFALIVFHGVLVPNTLARGAGVAVGMCVLSLTITGVAAAVHDPTGRHAGAVFAVAVTMLGAGAGLSVFGAAKTEALREKVREAEQAVRELGQYRLRKRLGQGGMGEVYLAEHRLLKRPCAVKRIHPKFLNNPEQVRRFEREVQATAQLRHPNTVEIYDYGRAADGTFFYVMEYIPGVSLEDLVARHGPMPAGRVAHLLRQVAGALKEAHRHGLVHRDIKPSNILVFPHGSPHDQAKLLDFGLVHTPEQAAADSHKITREGLIVGTPEYMSPEQASGLALDGRSDLFSLGSVAYYMLTGREAFNRGNPMKTLLAVVGEEPAPLAAANPHVPADLAAVVRGCLTKPAAERYQTAAALDAALAACGCTADWTEKRAADWWDRHPDCLTSAGTDLEMAALPGDEG